jgi:hypothetical protein
LKAALLGAALAGAVVTGLTMGGPGRSPQTPPVLPQASPVLPQASPVLRQTPPVMPRTHATEGSEALPTSAPPATPEPAAESKPGAARSPAPPAAPVRPSEPEPAAPAPRPTDPLEGEIRGLGEAHGALKDGDPARALALLDEQSAAYADGQLRQERDAARVLALCKLGRTDDGRALAARFLAENPRSPLTDRVRAACPVSNPH